MLVPLVQDLRGDRNTNAKDDAIGTHFIEKTASTWLGQPKSEGNYSERVARTATSYWEINEGSNTHEMKS